MTAPYIVTVWVFAAILGGAVVLGIALMMAPWRLTVVQTIGLALLYLVVDTVVAALIAVWVTHDS